MDALDVHSPAVTPFVGITGLFDEGVSAAIDAGLIPKLVALLDSVDAVDLCQDALRTMRSVVNNDDGKAAATGANALPAIARHLTHPDADCRLLAAGM